MMTHKRNRKRQVLRQSMLLCVHGKFKYAKLF
jgi:hypothetical protein